MQNAELQFLVHMCVAVLPAAFSMLLMMGSSRVHRFSELSRSGLPTDPRKFGRVLVELTRFVPRKRPSKALGQTF